MYLHPNSYDHNFVEQFPEIFPKYEVLRFQLKTLARMSDFHYSSSFLFGSQTTQDIGMVTSAIERACHPQHQSFEDYIRTNNALSKLTRFWFTKSSLRSKLEEIIEDYREAHGQKRNVVRFYLEYLDDAGKKQLVSHIALPPQLIEGDPQSENDQLKSRLNLLLDFRHGLAHKAEYIPLSDGTKLMPHEKRSHTWFVKLSFSQFYEVSRRALANFWLKEYEEYLADGGAAIIDERMKRLLAEIDALNASLDKKPSGK
ncbi:MAG: hypothetical protein WAZ27_01840 [Minisyncoccia bacterium]